MRVKHNTCLIILYVLGFTFSGFCQPGQVDTLCAGTAQVRYGVQENAGSRYSWSAGGGVVASGNGTASVTVNWGNIPGHYELNVVEQNASGCIGDLVKRMIYLKGDSFHTSYPKEACVNDSVTFKVNGADWYSWSNGQTDSFIRIRLLHDTTISVIVRDTSCGNRVDTLNMWVKARERPKSGFNTSTEEIFLNQKVELRYSGNEKDNVFWEIQKADVRARNAHLVNTIFMDTGLAVIRIVSINPFGCLDTFYRELEIRDENLFIPNAFTPNGDGLNDLFKVFSRNMQSFRLVIVNRWGEIVFSNNDPEQGWDGTWKGAQAPEGVYTFQCEATGRSGRYHAEAGSITLLR